MMYDEYEGDGITSKPSLLSILRAWKRKKKIELAKKLDPEPYKWFRASHTFEITSDMKPGSYTFFGYGPS